MLKQASSGSVYDESKFRRYVTDEYKNSQRKEQDEMYRIFEINLLHLDSGLRLRFSTSESYDGETLEYKFMDMFVITSSGEQMEVVDVDFMKHIFYSETNEIPFSSVTK